MPVSAVEQGLREALERILSYEALLLGAVNGDLHAEDLEACDADVLAADIASARAIVDISRTLDPVERAVRYLVEAAAANGVSLPRGPEAEDPESWAHMRALTRGALQTAGLPC